MIKYVDSYFSKVKSAIKDNIEDIVDTQGIVKQKVGESRITKETKMTRKELVEMITQMIMKEYSDDGSQPGRTIITAPAPPPVQGKSTGRVAKPKPEKISKAAKHDILGYSSTFKDFTAYGFDDGSTAYAFTDGKGHPCLTLYSSDNAKRSSFAYYYPSEERRNARIAELEQGAKANVIAKADQKAKKDAIKSKPTDLKVGDILYSSWGYNATNVSFYKIVKQVASVTYLLQKLRGKIVRGDHHDGSVIATDEPYEVPFKVRITGNNYVRINSVESAWKWDGKPKSFNSD